MQELKPVGFLAHDNITGKDFYVPAEANYGVGRTPLYALPATHRIVPVELLKWALLEIPWALRDDETSTRIRAIIDKEPT